MAAWRNWQTLRSQKPAELISVGVRIPPPPLTSILCAIFCTISYDSDFTILCQVMCNSQ